MSNREERRARRRARREQRRNKRKIRRNKLQEIISAVKETDFKFDLDTEDPDFADAFNEVWPVLKPSLEYAQLIRITGPRADKILQKVIHIGHRLSTGEAAENEKLEFITYLDSYWDKVAWVLEIIQVVTPDKVDDVLEKVIEIGEWITDNEDEEVA